MLKLIVYTHKPVGSHGVQELPVNKNKVDSFIHSQCNSVGHVAS